MFLYDSWMLFVETLAYMQQILFKKKWIFWLN